MVLKEGRLHVMIQKPRPSLSWEFKQRRLAVCCRRFGTIYRSHHQGSCSPRRKPGTLRCRVI